MKNCFNFFTQWEKSIFFKTNATKMFENVQRSIGVAQNGRALASTTAKAAKTSHKEWIPAALASSLLFHLLLFQCQMLTCWSWILKVLSKLGKRKNKSFPCVRVLHKTLILEVSRSSRATTAKKWTKSVIHVQSKLLFCPSRYRRSCWSNKSSLFTSVNILYCFIRVRLTVQVLVVPPVHLQ